MAKKLAACEISHNDIGEKDRGIWRKYNPYNPYVAEDDEKEKIDNLKVESLDDLFDDDILEEKKEIKNDVKEKEVENKKTDNEEEKDEVPTVDLSDFDEAPILPQEDNDFYEYDLQKELEAKFDELFGPVDGE